jgi:hypothetical protein
MATETLMARTPADAKRWTELVESSAMPDVYYLPEYACATAEIERALPMALIAGPTSGGILAPLLVRRMIAMVNGSSMEWLDASTPEPFCIGSGGRTRTSSLFRTTA